MEKLTNSINIIKSKEVTEYQENLISIGKLAAQVAHDLRSPLLTINILINQMKQIPDRYKEIMLQATQQLNDIANNLLSKYRNNINYNSNKNFANISDLVKLIIIEKELQYKNYDIKFMLEIEDNCMEILSEIAAPDFKNILSNIINNSVEAINGLGEIKLKLYKLNSYLFLDISDNGSGISDECLNKISNGIKFSTKSSGSGLGISSAREIINSWGGYLNIESKLNSGTNIKLALPIA